MIGNDIIDLEIPISPNWNSSRFLNKLFSSAEQKAIFNSEASKTTLQLLWSLKESAYKAHQRRFNLPRTFNPHEFQCLILSEEKGKIHGRALINNYTYFTTSTITSRYIHSIATSKVNQETVIKLFKDEKALNKELFTEYSLLLREHQSNFSIQKNKNKIPYLYLNSTRLEQLFSLSHHGKYSAFSIALMNS